MAQTLHWVTWRQIYCGDDTQRVLKCENLSSHTVMCFPFLVAVKEKWRWTRVIIVPQFLFIFYFMLNVFNSLSLQWDSRVGFVVSGFILWKCFLVLPFLFLCCTSCTHHFRNRQKRVKTHTGLIICRFSWSRDSTYTFNCSNPAPFFLGKQILISTWKNRLSHNYELETAGFSTNHSFALFPVRSQQQAILQTTLHSFTGKRKQDFDITNTLEH